jgi:alanine racemase
MKSGQRRAWVDIDLGALQRNALAIAARAGVPLLPMVKADAYGLGAVAVARALESVEPWGYGVATIEEGAELRDAGVARRIMVFTPLDRDEMRDARALSLIPALSRSESIGWWAGLGAAPWHLAIDTGMSRAGVRWDEVHTLREVLRASPPEGAFTHFHSADRGDGSREVQEQRFREAVAGLPSRPPVLHTENGAAIERRGRSPWDIARPGIFLYGVACGGAIAPEPVVHLRSRIADIRTLRDGETVSYHASYRAVGSRTIATLSIGYADGVRRALSNRGSAIIRGRLAPIAGIVTMDMTMLDVTDVPGCTVGDIATLVGTDHDMTLDVGAVAQTADLSPYELLTGLRGRLHRQYGGAT